LARTIFDISTVSVASSFTVGTAPIYSNLIQPIGAGWFRVASFVKPETANSTLLKCRLRVASGGALVYLGDGVSGVFLDRALLEVGCTLGAPIDTDAIAGAGTKVLRYASHGFVTGAADIPPHVVFDPRLQNGPDFSRRAFGDLRVTGGGEVGGGSVELANADQALSSLLGLARRP